MINSADLIGLNGDQVRRFEELDREVSQSRESIEAWHRLLDRRRTDIKLGLHVIAGFALAGKPSGSEAGRLVRQDPVPDDAPVEREPFYVRSEAEARGLLMRCIDYLTGPDCEKLAHDKGYGERDKMAEWIMTEIRAKGGLAYIRMHAPLVFGIPLALPNA
ncbi:MAG: hypothetical protein QOF70_5767 [Acetobacteraceae bacterium]|jgi:hypothetical protein|nr:hypothetical protein [Acetobacteraceae bacterium]